MTIPSTGLEICNMALGIVGWTEAITAIDADSNKADRMCNIFYSITFQEMLELFAWGATIEHRPLVLTAGFTEYNDVFSTTAPTISAITKASPAVVTVSASHGFLTGHYGYIYDVTGMTEINSSEYNDVFYMSVSGNTVTLTGINSTNFTTYSSGGSIVRRQPHAKYDDGYTYDIPSNFIMGISLEDASSEYEIIESAGSKELLTTTQNAILTYVKSLSDDEDVDELEFTGLFLNTFALRLAIKLCVPLLGARAGVLLKETLENDYIKALAEAEIVEAKSVNVVADDTDPFITARI